MMENTNKYIKSDPWKIIESAFDRDRVKSSESLFSIGNGIMGQRANFEERYSGEMLQGSYIGGVYYPDKTRVGWWKNGYPDYFAKVLNSAFWIGIDVRVNGQDLDLAVCKVVDFNRELDMQHGLLTRSATVEMDDGTQVRIDSVRFISLERVELGVVKYSVTAVNRSAEIEICSYIDADVRNEDANYDEKFWAFVSGNNRSVVMRTKKSGFEVCWSMNNQTKGISLTPQKPLKGGEYLSERGSGRIACGESVVINKYVGICSSMNHAVDNLLSQTERVADGGASSGFDILLAEQRKSWMQKWSNCDIEIEGDIQAQQGIRYCIFMLLQTYTGTDNRLNIGPKGFTGEKYGGCTYWDTEAYCLQFYLSTAGRDVARELLIYRYNHLQRAIENGEKLGFKGGAALYPMVTMNGEECHNEWEITFEEIHRNGAIAFAIYNYIRYTGEREYLAQYGLEVLIAIARFWSQRATFSQDRDKYVILGVTGPNEYENNVNNNWYTNYIACWCMDYALESAEWVRTSHPLDYKRIVEKSGFDFDSETKRWRDISTNMHLPEDKKLGIMLQQDGYMDKEQIMVADLDSAHRPINQKWSWDRILRSCFIKQADVLQGMYFFGDKFDKSTLERNFRFYEQRTVHESSLSPCVHAILATRIGDHEKAYQMYLRTARLDLDDYNHEIDEGCHITSMAGSWLSVVEGFGGMRVENDLLSFTPSLPKEWGALSFKIDFRGETVGVRIEPTTVAISLKSGKKINIMIDGKIHTIESTPHSIKTMNSNDK